MCMLRILVLFGFVRFGFLNIKLVVLVVKKFVIYDVIVIYIFLKDYFFLIYDGDFEDVDGVLENVWKLKILFVEYDGIFLVCLEYNVGIMLFLKNIFDWISCVKDFGEVFCIKIIVLGVVFLGGFGGMCGLIGIWIILEVGFGVMVLL